MNKKKRNRRKKKHGQTGRSEKASAKRRKEQKDKKVKRERKEEQMKEMPTPASCLWVRVLVVGPRVAFAFLRKQAHLRKTAARRAKLRACAPTCAKAFQETTKTRWCLLARALLGAKRNLNVIACFCKLSVGRYEFCL
jgi:hypothetical protein